MITTTDLSRFSFREIGMASRLLNVWANGGLPDDFEQDEITVMMNTSSGNVFLTNSENQVVMMNGDSLESFYSCPICGHEGFKEDIQHNEDDEECQEWLRDVELGNL